MRGTRPITDAEIDALKVDMRNTRDLLLIVLCATTGFRISEALSIKVADVCDKGAALDRVTVQRRNMKGRTHSRTMLLHPEAKAGIEALIYEQRLEPHHYLFRSRKGANEPIGTVQAWRVIKTAFARIGMQGKVATHSMRKYFAGKVYDALDKDIFKTSKALGHQNLDSTAAYLSFKTEEIDAAVLSLRKA